MKTLAALVFVMIPFSQVFATWQDDPSFRYLTPEGRAHYDQISNDMQGVESRGVDACFIETAARIGKRFRKPVVVNGKSEGMYGSSVWFTVNDGEWICGLPLTGGWGVGVTCTNSNSGRQRSVLARSQLPKYCY